MEFDKVKPKIIGYYWAFDALVEDWYFTYFDGENFWAEGVNFGSNHYQVKLGNVIKYKRVYKPIK